MSMQTPPLQPVLSTGADHALQRLAKSFAVLIGINDAVLRSNSRQDLFQRVCEAALHSGNFNGAVVLLPEPETGMLKAAAGAGENVELLKQVPFSMHGAIVHGNGMCGRAFRTQKVCINNKLFSDERARSWQARRAGVGASAAIPLIQSGTSVGVLMVTFAETDSLDDDALALLSRMADNLSFGLDNLDGEILRSRSENAARRLRKMFAALVATNEAVLRPNSQADLLQHVCEAALHSGDFVAAVIFMLEPGTEMLKAAAGAGDDGGLRAQCYLVSEPSPANGLAGMVFRTRKPFVSDDVLSDERTMPWQEGGPISGARAVAAVPLIRAGASVGVLVVTGAEAGMLDDDAVSLLVRMTENLSFGLDILDQEIERKRSERGARRLAKMYAALSATNEAILYARTADELYELVCDAAVHVGNALAAAVLLVEPGTTCLRSAVSTGHGVEHIQQRRFSTDPDNIYGKGVCGRAFRTQATHVNEDLLNAEQSQSWQDASLQAGMVATCGVPLIKGGKSIGVILFIVSKSSATEREIIALLTRIGNNVSFALENFDRADEKNRADERIQYLATHDDLTNLPNRLMFNQLFERSIKQAQRNRHKCAVLFIDLDRFKVINDSLGHSAGDTLLVEAAKRLRGCVRESDVVARLGGDEFVVVLSHVSGQDEVAVVARKILAALLLPTVLAGHECRTTGSVGIAVFPDNGADALTLTKNADIAMYLAKEEGKNDFRFFSSEIKSQSIERLMLEADLRRALELDQFTIHYQPKLDAPTGRITGVEALLRWHHPKLGHLPPTEFISLAEETGLIIPIGLWVLKTACAQNMAWQREGLPLISVAVNLSPRQFLDENLLSDIDEVLTSTGMPAHLLQLEITESMVMQNVDRAIKLLNAIQSRHVRLAIDDFGTGYSSMSLMKKFPIDTIKIDRSFVRDLETSSQDRAIAKAIISMGKALGLTVVAEGVETAEQDAFLRGQDCDELQGYLFSKPIPAEDIPLLLRPTMSSPSLQPLDHPPSTDANKVVSPV
ncbi:MAG: EAL domain-containing protein [Bradyrhizobium sp.]